THAQMIITSEYFKLYKVTNISTFIGLTLLHFSLLQICYIYIYIYIYIYHIITYLLYYWHFSFY
ncbi:MAG: hypothetical protein N7Q72_02655, partial [Spiroplasma sp. Tabriz.8]|nr:hypothetical protein [Spiroplasma sp. Tabriz.8]